jgi:hypothetical protein
MAMPVRCVLYVILSLAFVAACGGDGAAGEAAGVDGAAPDVRSEVGAGGAGGTPVDARASDVQPGDAPTSDVGRGDVQPEEAAAASFTPYFADDFERYADGTPLTNRAPFDAAGRTVASSNQAHSGDRSARMAIRSADAGGFGQWGGLLEIAPPLAKGGEVWVRLYVYWPSSFVFNASPWMKFLRLHNRAGDGKNAGYNDLYVDKADATTSVLRTIKEFHDVWAVYDGPPLRRDAWERYEMYLRVDDLAVDQGGQGRVRIWRDDTLIFDRTDVPTITQADGTIDYFYLFTYWNDESPPDNDCFIDDLVIATDRSPPPNRDAAGNRYIGTWLP